MHTQDISTTSAAQPRRERPVVRQRLLIALIGLFVASLALGTPPPPAAASSSPKITYIRFKRNVSNIFVALCINQAESYQRTRMELRADGTTLWEITDGFSALNGCVEGVFYYSDVVGGEHLVVRLTAQGGGVTTTARFDLYPEGQEWLRRCSVQSDSASPLIVDPRPRWDTTAGYACAFIEPEAVGEPTPMPNPDPSPTPNPDPSPTPNPVTRPATPGNLQAEAPNSTSIRLRWQDTAANETGFYVYRWDGARREWSRIATLGSGTTEYQDLGLTCGWDYFYEISAFNAAGESARSNQVRPTVPCDIGFRPNPDGFQFQNWGINYNPFNPFDSGLYKREDLVQMFGRDAACAFVVGNTCFLKLSADLWFMQMNSTMRGGLCYGFATSSLLFFQGKERDKPFNLRSGTTFSLGQGDAERHIAWNFVKQNTQPVLSYRVNSVQKSPAAILYELRDMMQSPSNDLPTLIFFDNGGGHAVTPYRLEHQGDGKFNVWVYDNNMPGDTDQIFEFDTVANTWRYDHQNDIGVWSGNASDKSVGLVPNSKQSASPACPWCSTNLSDAPMMQVWADAATIVENASAQRLGPQVATIPEGSWAPILTGATIERAIYLLPATGNYQLILDGAAEGTQSGSVAQFGPGYALSVQSSDLPDTARRTITTAPDGRSVTYRSTDATTTTITIANDNIGVGLQVAVQDMEVGPDKALAVEVNDQSHSVTVNNHRGSAGTYRLQLERLDGGTKLTFTHTLALQAGAIQQLSYQQWAAGKDEVTLQVDVNGDGTIDETRVLRDEGNHTVYLPLLRR